MTTECDQQMFSLQRKFLRAENQFQKACNQIVLMNKKLRDCNLRYQRARSNNMRTFRYPLRLRLAVIEGVRNMYFDYATRKAQEVEHLRDVIANVADHVITIDSDEEL